MPFSRVLYIEQEDFREVPPPKYFRLSPGVEVRLRYAYFVKCVGVVKDPTTGAVAELRCTYDPATRGGDSPDGRKVKSTLHWVSAAHALEAEVRLYNPLFTAGEPRRRAGGRGLESEHQSELAGGPDRLPRRAEPEGRRAGRRGSSSSASATSAWTRIPRKAAWSSTAP